MASRKRISRRRRNHALRRAAARYGVVLTASDLVAISELVRGKKTAGTKLTVSRSVHDVEYKGKIFRVVYHRRTQEILTFLPEKSKEEMRCQSGTNR